MNIKFDYPPNYPDIVKAFPAVKDNLRVVFTYGDTLYVPGKHAIPGHLKIHEQTHMDQQAKLTKSAAYWWELYIDSPAFRVEQELEAYGNQYAYINSQKDLTRSEKKRYLRAFATDLASEIYGQNLDVKQTMDRIVSFAKSSKLWRAS